MIRPIHLRIIWMGRPSVQSGGRSDKTSFANYMDHKDGLAVTKKGKHRYSQIQLKSLMWESSLC